MRPSTRPRKPSAASLFHPSTTSSGPRLSLRRLFRLPPRLRRRARRSRLLTMLILLLTLLLLFLPPYIIYRPPRLLIAYLSHRYPDVIFHVPLPPSAPKLIALTIDDAPSAHTRAILSLLQTHNAHATFFLIGAQATAAADTSPTILPDLLAAGNELANHAWHDEPSISLPPSVLTAQLTRLATLINHTHLTTSLPPPPAHHRFFRPGSGWLSPTLRHIAHATGHRLALADVYPHDAQLPWPALNAWHVLSMVRPGSVILCHDRRAWTVPMLERVLPRLKERGYEVVTLGRLVDVGEGRVGVEELGAEGGMEEEVQGVESVGEVMG